MGGGERGGGHGGRGEIEGAKLERSSVAFLNI
jgi:hypothetical protein